VVSNASAGSVVIQVTSGFLERSTVSPRERHVHILILQHAVLVGRSALRRREIENVRTTVLGDGSSVRRLRRA
jgi:hypothetical protein